VPGLRIVLDNFPASHKALAIHLPKYHIPSLGCSYGILLRYSFDCIRIKQSTKELDEGGFEG
jgi:hypothetical protein